MFKIHSVLWVKFPMDSIEYIKPSIGKILFVAVPVFVLLICLGKQAIAEETDGDVMVISPQCIMAIYRSLDDLENFHFPSNSYSYPSFKEYVEESFSFARCSDDEDKISISFFPPEEVQRGGGATYLIDKKDSTIIERTFGR